ncbi:hypothetical protein QBC37DRAFT_465181 [Rhypophila decipiens]|uniref:C2H2-type domain-containing protein n=1 Tax=Rhypophila decipiens TaxID=261697 RepID=A0AAN6Y7D8_9PEZI|nr:hypothetical protein QBC37DRAFT_465181 [Rhypophila decipiens]
MNGKGQADSKYTEQKNLTSSNLTPSPFGSDIKTTQTDGDPAPVVTSPSSTLAQTPSTSESGSGISSTYVAERKRQVIDRVLQTVTIWLRSRFELSRHRTLTERIAGVVCGEGSSTTHSVSEDRTPKPKSQLRSASRLPERHRNGKRKASDRQDDEDNEEDKAPPSKTRIDKGKAVESLKFACPYFKYNKTKYKSWRGCPGPGWPDVHRVKEHLYRRHRQPKYRCNRCWQPFEDEQTIIEHQRNVNSCPLKPMEPVEGFDTGQEARLKSRKKAITELSEVEKWKATFRILFPHVDDPDIPSPFYEYDQDSPPSSLSACEEYIVKEVPLRLRHILAPELDRDLNIVEEGLKRKAIDCLKTLLVDAFREFRKLDQKAEPDQPSSSVYATQGNSQQPPLSAHPQGNAGAAVEDGDLSRTEQMYDLQDENLANREQPAQELGSTRTEFHDLELTDISFDNEDFELEGLDLDFLSNPDNLFGEIPIMENLLQPFDTYSHGDNDGGQKKLSDSGYDSSSNSPQQTLGYSSEL